MGPLMIILCVLPTLITPITISPNGNSPEVKMVGGMMVDIQKGFVPMTAKPETSTSSNYDKSRKLSNDTNLSINERYRRLIPYMTFYYANDLAPTTESYSAKNVEVEKAEIVEAKTLEHNQRQPKKIIYSAPRNIPRYQGNRLTHFNLASSNPTKVYYKEIPVYQNFAKVTPNYNPLLIEHKNLANYEAGRYVQKQIIKPPSVSFTSTTRKPYLNLYSNEDSENVRYYFEAKESPKFKLVPYEQTPPVQVPQPPENNFEPKQPVPVLVPKEHIYIKPRPTKPQYIYENIPRKYPAVVSESYYEKRRPIVVQAIGQPIIESGFKPILHPVHTTEAPVYTTSPYYYESERPQYEQVVETASVAPEVNNVRPNYYQYVVEQPTYRPESVDSPKATSLADLLNSLQLNKSIPKPITRENVGSSIRTLLQVLNALKAMTYQNDVEVPVLSSPKPFVVTEEIQVVPGKPAVEVTTAHAADVDLHEEPYLAHVNTPSQHLDDSPTHGSTSQRFPQPVHSDGEGGTPGSPGVDYPVLTAIPHTSFDCKTQRYKGFFADPETRCQVWHYCDLNGGQASFLCPNGTIFSQAGLTCDWWFNVKCASTTQLYVLNESLYKYILPHSPKFPEDYSGPLVDKYLTLKFKEMEEQFKKNKNKHASEKMDDEDIESTEDPTDKTETSEKNKESGSEVSTVSEVSVVLGSPGTSGNVERLQDD